MSRPFFILGVSLLFATACSAEDDLGLKVPPGFKVTLYADEKLANDIYCMTLDPQGRVLVSSKGWVKRLEDTDGDGKADKAVTLIETKTGAMGMVFDYKHGLYLAADNGIHFYREMVDDGTRFEILSPPVVDLKFGEHGVHSIRKGPDGWFYAIAGNDAGLASVKWSDTSPIKKPEAGGLFRFRQDKIECIAHGFRNPYDFDFTPQGDVITYDSDTERDFLLPWYTPTRLFHVAWGGHHGWRLPGYQRSLARRDYYCDTVDMLAPMGRGSPTGVVCYRHTQFPPHYRGGVFALDWTFGKVYFCELKPNGSTYKTTPEVFLESTGNNGFAPTGACVAPDGSLFICIGGRGTRGAVYRIEYVGDGKQRAMPRIAPASELEKILEAPQPLDAWSRKIWEGVWNSGEGITRTDTLIHVLKTEAFSIEKRMRALETTSDLGLYFSAEAFNNFSSLPSPIRAKIANVIGQSRRTDGYNILLDLAQDDDVRVRVEALNGLAYQVIYTGALKSLLERSPDLRDRFFRVLAENLNHPDKRVAQAATFVAESLQPADVERLAKTLPDTNRARIRLWWVELAADRQKREPLGEINALLVMKCLTNAQTPEEQLDALRLLMLVYGDWNVRSASDEAYCAYSLPPPKDGRYFMQGAVTAAVRANFPNADHRVNLEASRLLAMLEDPDPKTVEKLFLQFAEDSTATSDVHFLIVLSRLKGKRTQTQTIRLAEVLLGLDQKLQGRQMRIKQTWGDRLAEVIADLLKQHVGLADELMKRDELIRPANIPFTRSFDKERKQRAAEKFRETIRKDSTIVWSPELIDLLALLPAREVRPLFRKQWSEFGLRDGILKALSSNPEEADRERFLIGLDSTNRNTVGLCIAALTALPRDPSPNNLVPILKRFHALRSDPSQYEQFNELSRLIRKQAGKSFDSADAIFVWFEEAYPKEAKLLHSDGAEDPAAWTKRLSAVLWEKGNVERGAKLFQERSCAACHAAGSRVGPDLTGPASRFSRDDLFIAIIDPSRNVAPAYRVDEIETSNGKRISGIVVFESADGVMVQTDATTTMRIAAPDIASRKPSTKSLMPGGLLKDLKPEDLADLYAYLKSLAANPKR